MSNIADKIERLSAPALKSHVFWYNLWNAFGFIIAVSGGIIFLISVYHLMLSVRNLF